VIRRHACRPVAVAAVLGGAFLLPLSAAAAPPTTVSCADLDAAVGNDRLDCRPIRYDGLDGLFISSAPPVAGQNPADTSAAPAPAGMAQGAAGCPTSASGAPTVANGAPGGASRSPAPVAAPTLAGAASHPGDVLDLTSWYLTLPTGSPGRPDTVENPTLATFTDEFFTLNDARDGVVFRARADGVTTKNSRYPRSELREMNGTEKAAWTNTTGTHTLDVCEAVTKVPPSKPEVVAAQIHDASDDVMQVRLEGQKLALQYDDGGTEAVIDPDYALGTPFHVRIVAAGGKVEVLYNGEKKAELPLTGAGWYWKVGAYVQSNTSTGDAADAMGEVVVYSLSGAHA
jgi:hypothetical protein